MEIKYGIDDMMLTAWKWEQKTERTGSIINYKTHFYNEANDIRFAFFILSPNDSIWKVCIR